MVRNDAGGQHVLCTVRGKLRLKDMKTTNPIAVGDKVVFEESNPGEGVIIEVMPRRNYIIRKSSNLSRQAHILAANIDRAYLVVTLRYPQTNYEFIDRFLVTAEAYKIPVTLVVNKLDLYTSEELKEEQAYFRYVYNGTAAYPVIETSALENKGIDTIRSQIKGNICLFSGNSGAGKSTLLNAIDPSLDLKTEAISDAHHKGTHTTSFYEMFETADGFIIDSPGIKGFGLIDIDKSELYHFFPEMFREAANCKFNMCTHTHEPGCAVKKAVEEGIISKSRYISYLKIMEGDEDSKYR
jgi:ribosome biogenesis GTPase